LDILSILRKKIVTLPEGNYSAGLQAVLLHIEVASRHLTRGQQHNDETAYTDAIYRTNQAFEGGIKEAYRVLAEENPDKKRPYDIENYFAQQSTLPDRILTQFTNYRTDWRNPSTHNYKLDFDESEAFLAIISVTGFACVLIDQVAERLSFVASKKEADSTKPYVESKTAEAQEDLIDRFSNMLLIFSQQRQTESLNIPIRSENQLIGAVMGFISSVAPTLELFPEKKLVIDKPERADLVVSDGKEEILVEFKRNRLSSSVLHASLAQLERYLTLSNLKMGILYFFSDQKDYEAEVHQLKESNKKIIVIKPKK
jgi:hypothetical protein